MPAEQCQGLERLRARETVAQGQSLPQRLGVLRGPELDEFAEWIVAVQVQRIVSVVHRRLSPIVSWNTGSDPIFDRRLPWLCAGGDVLDERPRVQAQLLRHGQRFG